MQILHLKNTFILEQLQLEEALLRTGVKNICIINEGSDPAIVMGISAKPEELIDFEKHQSHPIPIIKRYSGGGSVVIDKETILISLICNKSILDFEPYPEPLMRWSAELYKKALPQIPFELRENDYVIGQKKVGGNAQYLTKHRFVHHTTFLWSYQRELMDLLKHPKKTPAYRNGRSHEEFVTRLSNHIDSKEGFISSFKEVLKQEFPAHKVELDEVASALDKPHHKSTQIVLRQFPPAVPM